MTFTLTLQRTFVADHFHDLPGFIEARHGHNWEVAASVRLASEAEEDRFSQALDAWVGQVDYRLLNDLAPLAGRNPTAEALAQWALEHLRGRGLAAEAVRVREKVNYWALCRAGETA